MIRGGHLFTACGLFSILVAPLVSGQVVDKASLFTNITNDLVGEFAPDIASLNETWQGFLKARSEVNETAAGKPWLTETSPGSGLFNFSLAGLEKFKSKVMEMVEQKNDYLAQEADLQQRMTDAIFNASLPHFEEMPGSLTSDEIEEEPIDFIRNIHGLEYDVPSVVDVDEDDSDNGFTLEEGEDSDAIFADVTDDDADDDDEEADVSEDAVIEPMLPPPQTSSDEKVTAFGNTINNIVEDFAPDIASLNETWQGFLKARSQVNETASEKPWLTETSPGSGLFNFSLAGLAKFKSKVMEMVEKKNDYLAQGAELRQRMTDALFNASLPHFEEMQGSLTSDEIEEEPIDFIRKIAGFEDHISRALGVNKDGSENGFTLEEDVKPDENDVADVSDDDAEEEEEQSGNNNKEGVVPENAVIDSMQPPPPASNDEKDTPGVPASAPAKKATSKSNEDKGTAAKYRWINPFWSLQGAKKKQDYIQERIQNRMKQRQAWHRFAATRASSRQSEQEQRETAAADTAGASAQIGDAAADTADVAASVGAAEAGDASESISASVEPEKKLQGILTDVKDQLRTQFGAAIVALNETRNTFLQAKEDIALQSAERPWSKASVWGGPPTFDPKALMAFKAKIRSMVAGKIKYVAEKAKLKQDMIAALRDLLLDRLAEMGEVEVGEASSGDDDTASITDISENEKAVDSILEKIIEAGSDDDIDDDVLDDLPFGQSLKLAVASSSSGTDDVTAGSEGSYASAVAVVVVGAVAVVACVVVLGGVALKIRGRRSPYTKLG